MQQNNDVGNLILGRKIGQSIMIGDDTMVTLIKRKYDTYYFAVSAPRSTAVHRLEIYERIQDEKR